MRGQRGVGWVGFCLWAAVACDVRPETREAARCPPCECKCNCKDAAPAGQGGAAAGPAQPGPATSPTSPTPSGLTPQQSAELGELVASATRKMNFDDGKGCLADLDRIARLDPRFDARMAITRGMCEMLVGRCQDGKRRVARWYQEETNMHPERAAVTAESLASMRCRGGDSTDRDRLLRAYYELSDGAYMNKKTPGECKATLDVARALIPKVQPNGPEDSQIRDTPRALFHTAATCFGRAGDCRTAMTVYRELYPDLSSVPDAAMREKIIRDSFDSSIIHCAPRPAKSP